MSHEATRKPGRPKTAATLTTELLLFAVLRAAKAALTPSALYERVNERADEDVLPKPQFHVLLHRLSDAGTIMAWQHDGRSKAYAVPTLAESVLDSLMPKRTLTMAELHERVQQRRPGQDYFPVSQTVGKLVKAGKVEKVERNAYRLAAA